MGCDICGELFKSKETLVRHTNCNHTTRPTPNKPTDGLINGEDGSDIGYQEYALNRNKVADKSKDARLKKKYKLKSSSALNCRTRSAKSTRVQAQLVGEESTRSIGCNDVEDWFGADSDEPS